MLWRFDDDRHGIPSMMPTFGSEKSYATLQSRSELSIRIWTELSSPFLAKLDDLHGLEDSLIRIVIRETGDVLSAANQNSLNKTISCLVISCFSPPFVISVGC